MPELKVNIPDKILEETAQKKIASLERKVKSQEKKIAEYQRTEAEALRAIEAFKSLRIFLSDNFDLHEYCGF